MGLNSIILLLLLLVSLILVIFFMAKGWSVVGPLHSMLMLCLFFLCVTFFIFTGLVQGTRVENVHRWDRAVKQNLKLKQEIQRIQFGESTATVNDLANLVPLRSEVFRISFERGRVWRGVPALDFSNGIASVGVAATVADVPPNAPAAAAPNAAAAPTGSNIPLEGIVFVFGEAADTDGRMVPKFYLGEFFVAESTTEGSKLRPALNLTSQQLQALNSKQFPTLSAYEQMPTDSHTAFAEIGSKPTQEEAFGHMDPEKISIELNIPLALLDKPASEMTLEESRKAALLRSYVDDGKRAPEGTLQEYIWDRIKFLKEFTIDVDSLETKNALDGGYFDLIGRTVDSRLKRSADQASVTFRVGDEVLFPRGTADAEISAKRLVDNGTAQLIEPIFVRRLTDYAGSFKSIQLRDNKAIQDLETTRRETERAQQTEAVSQNQIQAKQVERELLSNDLAQLEKEVAVARKESERLTEELKELRAELSGLYKTSQELYTSLVKEQQAIAAAATN